MALPIIRQVTAQWVNPGDFPTSSTTTEFGGGGVAEHHPTLEGYRRDVTVAAESQNKLMTRGPLGSRIVELAALDGPVDIKRIPNNPLPRALANGMSGQGPLRRPVTVEVEEAVDSSSSSTLNRSQAVEGEARSQTTAPSPPPATPAAAAPPPPPPPPPPAPSPPPASASPPEAPSASHFPATGTPFPHSGGEAPLAGGGSGGEGLPHYSTILQAPQVQELLDSMAQQVYAARAAQVAAEAALASHAHQLTIVRTELGRVKAQGEREKAKAHTAVLSAEAEARTARESAEAAQSRRDLAETLLTRERGMGGASRRTSRANSVVGGGGSKLTAAVQTSPVRAANPHYSETQFNVLVKSPRGVAAAGAASGGKEGPTSGGGANKEELESIHASHRRVVEEYESRVSRISAAFAAARDTSVACKAETGALREEMERVSGELLRVGATALAAQSKCGELESDVLAEREENAHLQARVVELENYLEEARARERGAGKGVGVASLLHSSLSPRPLSLATSTAHTVTSPYHPNSSSSSSSISSGSGMMGSSARLFSPPPPSSSSSSSSSSSRRHTPSHILNPPPIPPPGSSALSLGSTLASGFLNSVTERSGGAVNVEYSLSSSRAGGLPVDYSATVAPPSAGVMAMLNNTRNQAVSAIHAPFYASPPGFGLGHSAALQHFSSSATSPPYPPPASASASATPASRPRTRVLKGEISRPGIGAMSPLGAALAHIVSAVPPDVSLRIGESQAVQDRDSVRVNEAVRAVQDTAAKEVSRLVDSAVAAAAAASAAAAGTGTSTGNDAGVGAAVEYQASTSRFSSTSSFSTSSASASASLLDTRASRLRAASVSSKAKGNGGGGSASSAQDTASYVAQLKRTSQGMKAAKTAAPPPPASYTTLAASSTSRSTARPFSNSHASFNSSNKPQSQEWSAGAAAAALAGTGGGGRSYRASSHPPPPPSHFSSTSSSSSATSLEAVAMWHPAAVSIPSSREEALRIVRGSRGGGGGEGVSHYTDRPTSPPIHHHPSQINTMDGSGDDMHNNTSSSCSGSSPMRRRNSTSTHTLPGSPSLLYKARFAAAEWVGAPPPASGPQSLQAPPWASKSGWAEGNYSGMAIDRVSGDALYTNASLARASLAQRPLAIVRPLLSQEAKPYTRATSQFTRVERGDSLLGGAVVSPTFTAPRSPTTASVTTAAAALPPPPPQQQHQQQQTSRGRKSLLSFPPLTLS